MISKLINRYPILRELFLYGIIGVTSAGLDSIVFAGLRTIGTNLYFSNFVGINIGIICSFLLNTFITFKITDRLFKRAVSFFGIGYCGMGLSMIILYFGITIAGLHELIVKIVSVFIVAAFQFVLNKLVTYRKVNKHG